MRRRQFIALTGAALLGLTQATAAKFFTIGYLALLPGEDRMSFMARFKRRLDELGPQRRRSVSCSSSLCA